MNSVKSSDDTQYGSVGNGLQVGSGYDVTIKRESETTALVSVEKVGTDNEWLAEIEVEADTDLQAEAKRIGQCPSAECYGMVSPESDEWSDIAGRWDAIEVV